MSSRGCVGELTPYERSMRTLIKIASANESALRFSSCCVASDTTRFSETCACGHRLRSAADAGASNMAAGAKGCVKRNIGARDAQQHAHNPPPPSKERTSIESHHCTPRARAPGAASPQ